MTRKALINAVADRKKLRKIPAKTIREVREDWEDFQFRRTNARMLAALAMIQLTLLLVQVFGILHPDADYLIDSTGDRDDVRYHIIVAAQSLLVVIQLLIVTKWYKLRIKNLSYFDLLWRNVTLTESHQFPKYVQECLVLFLHEPPGFVLFWNDSYLLGLLSLLRIYTLFLVLRSESWFVTQGGRIVCFVSRIHSTKLLAIRSWIYTHPSSSMSAITVIGWFMLSMAMYMAEKGTLTFQDSMWLTFITMTTVGYGDLSPTTHLGRLVACLSAVHGLVSSAMLVNVASSLMTLSSKQQKAVDFLVEGRMSTRREYCALNVVTLYLRYKVAKNSAVRQGLWVEIKHACHAFRRARREHLLFEEGMKEPDISVIRHELHDIKLLLSGADASELMTSPARGRSLTPKPDPPLPPAPGLNARGFDIGTQLQKIIDSQELILLEHSLLKDRIRAIEDTLHVTRSPDAE
eukprot:TRINITY_DN11712_c0_g1_i1.p1 TRINITY_DN11712_c0_g1~~TRINITY_DN11712_c0_g1_i1.p1  ORF type:complete len:462 (+),score=42.39 TRINITY_DN11712_c0_g1_i1:40-1425(+)